MFVACSTRCFTKEPLESALRRIAELEFDKIDLAIEEHGSHLKPSEVADDLDAVLARIRRGPSLAFSALDIDFGPSDLDSKLLRKRFEAMCRLAKSLMVAVMTMPAAPAGSSLDDEIKRLSTLCESASLQGLVLTLSTHSKSLTNQPSTAAALCRAVPGLGLTLDPTHYLNGPFQSDAWDEIYPYVQNVHFRDSGKKSHEFQVRVGQGQIEYNKIINFLSRHGYDRALTVAILDQLENPFEVEVEVRKLKLLLESLL